MLLMLLESLVGNGRDDWMAIELFRRGVRALQLDLSVAVGALATDCRLTWRPPLDRLHWQNGRVTLFVVSNAALLPCIL